MSQKEGKVSSAIAKTDGVKPSVEVAAIKSKTSKNYNAVMMSDSVDRLEGHVSAIVNALKQTFDTSLNDVMETEVEEIIDQNNDYLIEAGNKLADARAELRELKASTEVAFLLACLKLKENTFLMCILISLHVYSLSSPS